MKELNTTIDKVWEKIPVAKEATKRVTAEARQTEDNGSTFADKLEKAEKAVKSEKEDKSEATAKNMQLVKNENNDKPIKNSKQNDSADNTDANNTDIDTKETVVAEAEMIGDPVNLMVAKKVETIKAILKEMGIEVDDKTITDKDFLKQAIKILDHFLNPIHAESTTKIKISVQEIITVDIVRLPEQTTTTETAEPQENGDLTSLMQELLNELNALSLIISANSTKNTKEPILEEKPLTPEIENTKEELPSSETTPLPIETANAVNNTIESKTAEIETAQTINLIQIPAREIKTSKEVNTDSFKVDTKENQNNKATTSLESGIIEATKNTETDIGQQNQKNEQGENNPLELTQEALSKEIIATEETTDFAPEVAKAISELKESLSNIVNQTENHSQVAQITKTEQIEVQKNESVHNGLARPHSDKSIIQQITTRFQMVAAQSGTEVRIQLKPEHLGTVKISLEITQETVFAKLQVDSERVKHIVETNIAQLKDALQEQGLKMDKCEVSVNNGNEEFFKRELSEQGKRIRGKIRQGVDVSADTGIDTENSSTTDTAKQLGYSTIHFVA